MQQPNHGESEGVKKKKNHIDGLKYLMKTAINLFFKMTYINKHSIFFYKTNLNYLHDEQSMIYIIIGKTNFI